MTLALKEIWDTKRIRSEAENIENNLRQTTRKLMILEQQYSLKKMEFLARMEGSLRRKVKMAISRIGIRTKNDTFH